MDHRPDIAYSETDLVDRYPVPILPRYSALSLSSKPDLYPVRLLV